MTDLYPLLIAPRFSERIWGGHRLADDLGKAAPRDRAIGESWEVYDENTVLNGAYAGQTIASLRTTLGAALMGHHLPANAAFPLLTKLIDAHDVLSVQVHPDDAGAQRLEGQPNGKTECWYVLSADPGARLTYGFSRDTTADEYARLVAGGTLEEVLRQVPVQPGDVVYLPAGLVHAIGAGIVLYEVQQTSDITYRIYDWNRHDAAGKARDLHVEKARQVLYYGQSAHGFVEPLPLGDGRTLLIAGRYFCNELIDATVAAPLDTGDSPVVVCALEQPVQVSVGQGGTEVTLDRYSSLIVPAAATTYTLHSHHAAGPARAIVSYVPTSQEAVRTMLREQGVDDRESTAFLAQFTPLSPLGQPA